MLCFALAAAGAGADDQPVECAAATLDEQATLEQVVDGDTLRLTDGRLVRFIGINSPELGHRERPDEPVAVEASRYLRTLLRDSPRVGLRYGRERHDRYHRTLAHVYRADGRSIEAAMLQAGMAAQIVVPPNDGYVACYQRAEAVARAAGRGVWQSIYRPIEVDDLPRSQQGFRVIRGRIERLGEGRYTLWPNFTRRPGEAPRHGVSLRILRRDLERFTTWTPEDLVGRRVEARGWLYRQDRQLVMNLRHPSMLTILDGTPH